MNQSIKQEILKRYQYLYDNKEIILSLCIKEGIEEKYYKKCIKDLKKSLANFKKDGFKGQELINVFKDIESKYREKLKNPQFYLMDEIDNAVLQLIEDFLFADAPLEESALFSEIEHIKSDDLELSQAEYLIESLAQRRKLNEHLKNRNPFTVWRILNYVRKHNIKNEDVQSYLDIYYNLDRYVNSGLEWDSGYYLSESDYERNESFINSYPSLYITTGVNNEYEESTIITPYRENIFEKEDEYFELSSVSRVNYDKSLVPMTNFIYDAIWEGQIPESDKKRLKEKLQGNFKKYTY